VVFERKCEHEAFRDWNETDDATPGKVRQAAIDIEVPPPSPLGPSGAILTMARLAGSRQTASAKISAASREANFSASYVVVHQRNGRQPGFIGVSGGFECANQRLPCSLMPKAFI
jgi:hypothetical protein